jgi:hypothetical protein
MQSRTTRTRITKQKNKKTKKTKIAPTRKPNDFQDFRNLYDKVSKARWPLLTQLPEYKSNNGIELELQIFINYFLLLMGLRNIAQIEIYEPQKHILPYLENIMNKYGIKYILADGSSPKWQRIIIYNTLKIKTAKLKLNTTYGTTFGHQLGDFYICSKGDWANNESYNSRVWIRARIPSQLVKSRDDITVGIVAQMCPKDIITKNKIFFESYRKKIENLLQKLDPNITTEIGYKID